MKNEIIEFMCNNEDYLRDFITRSTYNSNAIEGSTLTFAETYAIIYNDNSFKILGKEPREIYEAINHKKALNFAINELCNSEFMLSEKFINDINKIINQDIRDTEGYRKVQVFIRGSEHIPPEPSNINNLMQYYVYNYNNDQNDVFYKIANYHMEFESIHPFEDGNGRTGRILINCELLKNNIAPVVIEKEDRAKYFEMLRSKDIEGLASWFRELSEKEADRINKFKQ